MALGTTTTAVAVVAQSSSSGSILPDSTVVGVLLSVLSAVLIYSVRQVWEKHKLKRALLTEVEQMTGIEACAEHLETVNEPPGRQLNPNDMPASGSIPTTVYESSAGKIGLLGSLVRGNSELQNAVEFYSEVLRYKSIMNNISDGNDVPHNDQEDLYDNISDLAENRKWIIQSSRFL